MAEDKRFPYRFFVVTFAWSWLIWLPLVLAGAGIVLVTIGTRWDSLIQRSCGESQ